MKDNKKTIYFTFDDGPSDTTQQLLDILKKHKVTACFFVTNDSQRPDLIKKIADEGHTVALHSYTHDYKTIYSSKEAFFEDLKKIDDLVYETTGIHSGTLRLPGGSTNTIHKRYCPGIMGEIIDELLKKGYRIIDWNCGNMDASGCTLTENEYVANFLCSVESIKKCVFLSHNRPGDTVSIRSIDRILSICEKNGWETGHIDDYEGSELIKGKVPAVDITDRLANPYLILVNRDKPFDLSEASGLKVIDYEDIEGFPVKIERETVIAYLKLRHELMKLGIIIGISSALRTYEYQRAVWNIWLDKYDGCVEECLKRCVPQQMSEHHTGLAFDFLMKNGDEWPNALSEPDYDDERFKIIHELCPYYGFVLRYPRGKETVTGIQYEPWHLRYVGIEHAMKMTEKGLVLEEYISLRKQEQMKIQERPDGE